MMRLVRMLLTWFLYSVQINFFYTYYQPGGWQDIQAIEAVYPIRMLKHENRRNTIVYAAKFPRKEKYKDDLIRTVRLGPVASRAVMQTRFLPTLTRLVKSPRFSTTAKEQMMEDILETILNVATKKKRLRRKQDKFDESNGRNAINESDESDESDDKSEADEEEDISSTEIDTFESKQFSSRSEMHDISNDYRNIRHIGNDYVGENDNHNHNDDDDDDDDGEGTSDDSEYSSEEDDDENEYESESDSEFYEEYSYESGDYDGDEEDSVFVFLPGLKDDEIKYLEGFYDATYKPYTFTYNFTFPVVPNDNEVTRVKRDVSGPLIDRISLQLLSTLEKKETQLKAALNLNTQKKKIILKEITDNRDSRIEGPLLLSKLNQQQVILPLKSRFDERTKKGDGAYGTLDREIKHEIISEVRGEPMLMPGRLKRKKKQKKDSTGEKDRNQMRTKGLSRKEKPKIQNWVAFIETEKILQFITDKECGIFQEDKSSCGKPN